MMNFYAGTLVELVIVELFVLWIWVQVLIDTVREKTIATRQLQTNYRKLLLTSIGLVCNAIAIVGIISLRIHELLTGNWPFVMAVAAFYIMLAFGSFLLILSAAIGTSMRLIKIFFIVSAIWTFIVLTVDLTALFK